MEAKKDQQIKVHLEEIKELKAHNEKMAKACAAAEKGTQALKNALNMCQDTLKDAI